MRRFPSGFARDPLGPTNSKLACSMGQGGRAVLPFNVTSTSWDLTGFIFSLQFGRGKWFFFYFLFFFEKREMLEYDEGDPMAFFLFWGLTSTYIMAVLTVSFNSAMQESFLQPAIWFHTSRRCDFET